MNSILSFWNNVLSLGDVVNQSKQAVVALKEATPENKERICAKNLFNTLQAEKSDYESFNLSNVNRLDYGSSSLYLEEMRSAAFQLLDEGVDETEKAIVEKWLKETELTQDILWIFDHYRSRISLVPQKVLAGKNPVSSWLPQKMLSLFSPGSSIISLISERIVQAVQKLEAGSFVVIPGGTFAHETFYVLEKDEKGAFQLYYLDPKTFPQQVELKNSDDLSHPLYWQNLISSKFTIKDKLFKKYEGTRKILYFLGQQQGESCFAHSQWAFFRFALVHQANDLKGAFSHAKNLEFQIKRRMINNMHCKDQDLDFFAHYRLEQEKLQVDLLSNSTLFEKLSKITESCLRSAHMNSEVRGNLETIEEFKKEMPSEMFDIPLSYRVSILFQIAVSAFSTFEKPEEWLGSEFEIIAHAALIVKESKQKKKVAGLQTMDYLLSQRGYYRCIRALLSLSACIPFSFLSRPINSRLVSLGTPEYLRTNHGFDSILDNSDDVRVFEARVMGLIEVYPFLSIVYQHNVLMNIKGFLYSAKERYGNDADWPKILNNIAAKLQESGLEV